MTPEDFLGIVTHTILDGQQRYIALASSQLSSGPIRSLRLQLSS